jgi:Reverse transcriptase (RNA-dependent DNA polymerase)
VYRFNEVEGAEEVDTQRFVAIVRNQERMYIAYITPATLDQTSSNDMVVSASITDEYTLPEEYEGFADVFSEKAVGMLPRNARVKHTIDIEDGQTVPYGPIYPLSQNELRTLHEYIDSSIASGRIRKSQSPAGAPILFTPKHNGSLRLCVDYRRLNRVTRKNQYPLPLLGEILNCISGACVFTKLDLRDAYHRIPIAEEDIWKTAFRTRYGHFKYTIMPFSLTNTPATFQSYINDALRGLLDEICVAYMDDILIFSTLHEEHADHVRQVLQRLREYSLYTKLSKCEF